MALPPAVSSLHDRGSWAAQRRLLESAEGRGAGTVVNGALRDPLSCFPDDLASRTNILIDPLELQAATMDDLDEDEEPAPAAAQVPR